MKKKNQGFTLLELVVAAAIVTTAIAWSIPSYMRSVRQGEVDRYNRAIETGFQNLKENLHSTKTTCIFEFSSTFVWKRPDQILEFRTNEDLSIDKPQRLRCCNSELKKHTGEECPNIEAIRLHPDTSDAARSLRFMWHQFTPDSERVQVAVSSSNYTMPPPGSNAETKPLTFMVRSVDSESDPSLKIRCMQIAGNNYLNRGTWQGELDAGYCDFADS